MRFSGGLRPRKVVKFTQQRQRLQQMFWSWNTKNCFSYIICNMHGNSSSSRVEQLLRQRSSSNSDMWADPAWLFTRPLEFNRWNAGNFRKLPTIFCGFFFWIITNSGWFRGPGILPTNLARCQSTSSALQQQHLWAMTQLCHRDKKWWGSRLNKNPAFKSTYSEFYRIFFRFKITVCAGVHKVMSQESQ